MTSKTSKSSVSGPLLLPISGNGDFLTEYQSPKKEGTAAFRSYPTFDGTYFENPKPTPHPGFKRAVSFMCSRAGRNFRRPLPPVEVLDAELPVKKVKFEKSENPLEITWIGHATSLVRLDYISIITDPVFGDYCAPVKMGHFKRFRQTPCSIDDLPEDLRIVVISHNHYDHLCLESVRKLAKRYGERITFCVPKGLAVWFRDNVQGLRNTGVVEMNWWQVANFELGESGEQYQVVAVPAQHWSMRHPLNRNKSLWAGWVVIGPSGRKFYFAGDTAYSSSFAEIGAEFGPIDLCAIPIGAYQPREFLCIHHVDPVEAVKIHCDVQSKQSLGVHWGTFRLGGEGTLDPRSDLAKAVEEKGLKQGSFITVTIGETFVVKDI